MMEDKYSCSSDKLLRSNRLRKLQDKYSDSFPINHLSEPSISSKIQDENLSDLGISSPDPNHNPAETEFMNFILASNFLLLEFGTGSKDIFNRTIQYLDRLEINSFIYSNNDKTYLLGFKDSQNNKCKSDIEKKEKLIIYFQTVLDELKKEEEIIISDEDKVKDELDVSMDDGKNVLENEEKFPLLEWELRNLKNSETEVGSEVRTEEHGVTSNQEIRSQDLNHENEEALEVFQTMLNDSVRTAEPSIHIKEDKDESFNEEVIQKKLQSQRRISKTKEITTPNLKMRNVKKRARTDSFGTKKNKICNPFFSEPEVVNEEDIKPKRSSRRSLPQVQYRELGSDDDFDTREKVKPNKMRKVSTKNICKSTNLNEGRCEEKSMVGVEVEVDDLLDGSDEETENTPRFPLNTILWEFRHPTNRSGKEKIRIEDLKDKSVVCSLCCVYQLNLRNPRTILVCNVEGRKGILGSPYRALTSNVHPLNPDIDAQILEHYSSNPKYASLSKAYEEVRKYINLKEQVFDLSFNIKPALEYFRLSREKREGYKQDILEMAEYSRLSLPCSQKPVKPNKPKKKLLIKRVESQKEKDHYLSPEMLELLTGLGENWALDWILSDSERLKKIATLEIPSKRHELFFVPKQRYPTGGLNLTELIDLSNPLFSDMFREEKAETDLKIQELLRVKVLNPVIQDPSCDPRLKESSQPSKDDCKLYIELVLIPETFVEWIRNIRKVDHQEAERLFNSVGKFLSEEMLERYSV